jgi:cobalt-zinc-cadmium efflux system membrane fusion protein
MAPRTISSRLGAAIAAALLAVVAIGYWTWHSGEGRPGQSGGGDYADTPNAASQSPDSVDLSDSQLDAVKVAPVEARDFPVEKNAIGSIDFDEEMTVQVFAPYEGRIIALFGSVGDDVKKGQTLFTIDSPICCRRNRL